MKKQIDDALDKLFADFKRIRVNGLRPVDELRFAVYVNNYAQQKIKLVQERMENEAEQKEKEEWSGRGRY